MKLDKCMKGYENMKTFKNTIKLKSCLKTVKEKNKEEEKKRQRRKR